MKILRILNRIRRQPKLLLELSLWQTVKCAIQRSEGPLLLVFRNSRVTLHRSAKISGKGELLVGKRWSCGHFFLTELIVSEDVDLRIDGRFVFYTGCCVTLNPGANFFIDSGYFNCRTIVDCYQEIKIGNGVAIAKECVLRDSDSHDISGSAKSIGRIDIEDHVWIGTRAIVLKGVSIGSGSVVAAGAVVAKNVDKATLVGGIPAKPIRNSVVWK